MGKLRPYLKSVEPRQDTLLWYCGDNGVPPESRLTTPFRGNEGQVYEGGLRVPGIIEWPARIRKPRATQVNAVTTDMLPTLREPAGQPLPQRPLDGIGLNPLLEGGMRERPNARTATGRDAAILGNRYQLVAGGKRSPESGPGPSPGSPATELYDGRDDRGETKNLIQVEPDIAKDMQRQLREWQRSVLASLTGADYR